MTDETTTDYLWDLVDLLKRSAREARAKLSDLPAGGDQAFESGRVTAYYEVISLMQQQAVAFGIGLDDIGLDDINPERDLL